MLATNGTVIHSIVRSRNEICSDMLANVEILSTIMRFGDTMTLKSACMAGSQLYKAAVPFLFEQTSIDAFPKSSENLTALALKYGKYVKRCTIFTDKLPLITKSTFRKLRKDIGKEEERMRVENGIDQHEYENKLGSIEPLWKKYQEHREIQQAGVTEHRECLASFLAQLPNLESVTMGTFCHALREDYDYSLSWMTPSWQKFHRDTGCSPSDWDESEVAPASKKSGFRIEQCTSLAEGVFLGLSEGLGTRTSIQELLFEICYIPHSPARKVQSRLVGQAIKCSKERLKSLTVELDEAELRGRREQISFLAAIPDATNLRRLSIGGSENASYSSAAIRDFLTNPEHVWPMLKSVALLSIPIDGMGSFIERHPSLQHMKIHSCWVSVKDELSDRFMEQLANLDLISLSMDSNRLAARGQRRRGKILRDGIDENKVKNFKYCTCA